MWIAYEKSGILDPHIKNSICEKKQKRYLQTPLWIGGNQSIKTSQILVITYDHIVECSDLQAKIHSKIQILLITSYGLRIKTSLISAESDTISYSDRTRTECNNS